MKTKIVGMLVCMLLIAATVLPVAGTMSINNTINKENNVLDNTGQVTETGQNIGRGNDFDWQVSGNNVYTGHGGSYPSGNVGIGTTSPNANLHIYENANGLVGIRIQNPNTGSSSNEGIFFSNEDGDVAGIQVWDDDSVYPTHMRIYNNRPGGSINFHTQGVPKMVIKNNGNVGIGINYPSKKLEVDGDIGCTNLGCTDIIASGKVGIGTTSPIYLLNVLGGSEIVAQFSGRVKGAQALNDDEFVTKAQVKSVVTNKYTPTGTSDINGELGDTAWDNSYFYVKTPDGWKRAALETWETPDIDTK